MATDNNITLFRSLDIFMKEMLTFITERLQRAFGENWWAEAVSAAVEGLPADAREPERMNLVRVHHIPLLLQYHWDSCFIETFKYREKTLGWLEEVVDVGRSVSPGCINSVSDDDTWRSIDTMSRLLRMINSPAANEILKLRGGATPGVEGGTATGVRGGEPSRVNAGLSSPVDAESSSNSYPGMDIDRLLEKKHKIEAILQKRFNRYVTVMFTDLQGSVAMGEAAGDIDTRLIIKRHRDILQPIISRNKGVLVKYQGDGSLSYFESAFDALSAAIQIQKSTDEYNTADDCGTPIYLRIGLHTGNCLVESNDLMGDVVNVSARIQALAKPGGILLSEETFKGLPDHGKELCAFGKTSDIKGKKGAVNLYKAVRQGVRSKEPSGSGIPSLLVRYSDGTQDSISLSEAETTIGRSKKCNIVLPEPFVSRNHAYILKELGVYQIKDLGSRIGVFVNDQRVSICKLKHGDIISIGENRITYSDNQDGSDTGKSSDLRSSQSEPESVDMDRNSLLKLLITSDKSEPVFHAIGRERMTIGSSLQNSVVLEGRGVADRHAALWLEGGRVFIEDLSGKGGTRVDNAVIPSNTPVELKKRVSANIGAYKLKVLDPEDTFDPSDFKTGFLNISKLADIFKKKI
jgi:class 3 adenylate cyclase/pSer/pThr/pTyr-binding forkhead associated (FHA) protein